MTEKKAIELHPYAWERFERAAGVVVKRLPQHRTKPKAKLRPPVNPERGERKSRAKWLMDQLPRTSNVGIEDFERGLKVSRCGISQ